MSNQIKISVIVPVYNVEKYIRKSIESLIGQTYKKLEIILVDDGSTDMSGEICDEYAQKDNRIIVIHKDNGGIVSARKAGIQAATGEYATNVDPDDWIEADAYECAIEKIEEYRPDVFSFGMYKDFEDFSEKRPVSMKEGIYTKEAFWGEFCRIVDDSLFFMQPMLMSQWDKVVRTELFRKHELNCSLQLKKNVDDAVVFPLLLDMSSIYIDSRCWYHYCVRKGSILWQTKEGDFERYQLLANLLLDGYERYGSNSGCNLDFLLYKLVHHMVLDIPERFFSDAQCKIYPKLSQGSNIIVYGKGVFANRLMRRIDEIKYCNVVANIDSKDCEKLVEIDNNLYDYVVIAIFNSQVVQSVIEILRKMKIESEKVVFIDKADITSDLLPEAVRKRYDSISAG